MIFPIVSQVIYLYRIRSPRSLREWSSHGPILCRQSPGRWWGRRHTGLPRWLSGKKSACQGRKSKRSSFDPWVRKIPWRSKWPLTRILAWEIPWTEGSGGPKFMGLQRVGHDWACTGKTHKEMLRPWTEDSGLTYSSSLPSQLPVSVDPLLNLICQPHSKDLILILPNYSNSSGGFFFLPRALKTDSHPYSSHLIIIPAEQASASAFGRNQGSDQLRTL